MWRSPGEFLGWTEALLHDSNWHSYCQYVAQRFGFPDVVARVLHSLVQRCDEKRLPAMHVFAWCHRSDLAALGFLYKEQLDEQGSTHHGQDMSIVSLCLDEECEFIILCIWCALFTSTSRVLDECCWFAYWYAVDTRVATSVHRIFAASRSQDNLPKEIQDQLQHAQGALLGDGLAACMINVAENELKMISKQRLEDHALLKSLNTWHHDFESLRAALSGRLPLPGSSRRQLHMLAFFSDFIPFLMEGGLDLLDKLMYQVFCGELGDRLALQKAFLNGVLGKSYITGCFRCFHVSNWSSMKLQMADGSSWDIACLNCLNHFQQPSGSGSYCIVFNLVVHVEESLIQRRNIFSMTTTSHLSGAPSIVYWKICYRLCMLEAPAIWSRILRSLLICSSKWWMSKVSSSQLGISSRQPWHLQFWPL